MSGLKIDHLGIIVADLEKAIERFRLLTGGEPAYTKEMMEVGLKIATFEAENISLELVEYAGDKASFAKQVMGEEVLFEHPGVEFAAAVGKPDSYAGELPVAFVQAKPNAQVTEEELISFCAERVAERAAKPVNIYLINQMPLTGVGKVFKPDLRRDAARRVFMELVEPLTENGTDVQVSVDTDPRHGIAVKLAIQSLGDGDEAAKSKLQDLFKPYAVHYEFVS